MDVYDLRRRQEEQERQDWAEEHEEERRRHEERRQAMVNVPASGEPTPISPPTPTNPPKAIQAPGLQQQPRKQFASQSADYMEKDKPVELPEVDRPLVDQRKGILQGAFDKAGSDRVHRLLKAAKIETALPPLRPMFPGPMSENGIGLGGKAPKAPAAVKSPTEPKAPAAVREPKAAAMPKEAAHWLGELQKAAGRFVPPRANWTQTPAMRLTPAEAARSKTPGAVADFDNVQRQLRIQHQQRGLEGVPAYQESHTLRAQAAQAQQIARLRQQRAATLPVGTVSGLTSWAATQQYERQAAAQVPKTIAAVPAVARKPSPAEARMYAQLAETHRRKQLAGQKFTVNRPQAAIPPVLAIGGMAERQKFASLLPYLQKVAQGRTALEKGVTEKDVDPEQLRKGVKVEQEHTTDKAVAKKIALDHLAEIDDYYRRLDKMEKKAALFAVKVALCRRKP